MTYRVVYDYCNLGGVTSVFKHRIADLRRRGIDTPFRFLFRQDLGGRSDLLGLPGVTVEICPSADFRAWAAGVVGESGEPVILVDQPEVLALLEPGRARILYEVHTSLEQTFRRMRAVDFGPVERIVCVSEWLRRKLGEVLPEVAADRFAVIHNFVDPSVFRRMKPATGGFSEPPILWVGKISADKNWEDGLDIVRLVSARFACTPVLVTGGAPDLASVTAFLYRAHALGFLEKMRWISNLAHDAMPALLNQVRAAGGVLLSTSKFESFGLAALEAMRCGLPVVAAQVGGLTEIFDGTDGHLFELGDNGRAAALIGGFLADPRWHAEAGRSLARRAGRFDRDRIMAAYVAILEGTGPGPEVPAEAAAVRPGRRSRATPRVAAAEPVQPVAGAA